LVGGHTGTTALRALVAFEPPPGITRNGMWQELPTMLARRSYLAAVGLDGHIFALGGVADGRMLNTFEAFNIENNEWCSWFHLPPMHTKRMQHAAVAASGGRIFVCGGFDGCRDMAVFECFSRELNQWTRKDNMTQRRSFLGLALANKHIWAMGGQDRLDGQIRALATVEAFDLHSERWIEQPPLSCPRIAPAVVSAVNRTGQFIYVCGGSDGQHVLDSMECFNVDEGKWTELPSMGHPRLSHAAAYFRDRLYVFGGNDGQGPLDTFQVYDPRKNVWGPLLKMGDNWEEPRIEEVEAEQAAAASKIQAIQRGKITRRQTRAELEQASAPDSLPS